jgi:hypothetical protein
MVAVMNAAECFVEAGEQAASLPFYGMLVGADPDIDKKVNKEYSAAATRLYQVVRGIDPKEVEPVTQSLAAMIRSTPGIPDTIKEKLLKGLED